MVRKILAPTDGSEASDNALAYAAEVAKLYEGELLILNVIRADVVTTYRQMDRESAKEQLMKEREEEAKRIIGRSVSDAEKMGINVEGIVRRGLPDEEIIALAREDDVVLIAMGAYGKNFLERQVVGSKTEGVLRNLPKIDVPLIVVPSPCKDVACKIADKTLRKILVPTDGSEASDNALAYAAEVAKLYEGELVILNVISPDVVTSYRQIDTDSIKEQLMKEREEEAKKMVGRSVHKAESQGVKAEGMVRRGLPDEEIVALTNERNDIALIVMGAYGKNFLERQLIGSKTEGVLRKLPHIEVPLVVVPCPARRK